MPTASNRISESELADLLPKVEAGERLSRSDCLRLWNTSDLTSLAFLANLRRERMAGNTTVFRPELHVNWTRGPAPSCPGCSTAANLEARPLSLEQWIALLEGITASEAAILHLTVGGDAQLRLSELCMLLRTAREIQPDLARCAFSWGDLERAANLNSLAPGVVLEALHTEGLQSIAGGSLIDLTPEEPNRKSTRLNSSHIQKSRMPSSA